MSKGLELDRDSDLRCDIHILQAYGRFSKLARLLKLGEERELANKALGVHFILELEDIVCEVLFLCGGLRLFKGRLLYELITFTNLAIIQ